MMAMLRPSTVPTFARAMGAGSCFRAPLSVRGVAYAAASASSSAAAAGRRGLRKDPEDYMVSHAGVRYPGTAETMAPVRKFLGDHTLPDELLLQSMVHKSFAHGKVPYNEKLAILGQQLFRVQAMRATAAVSASPQTEVNGHNFDVSQNAVELLTSTPVVSAVFDKAGLQPALFAKPASDKVGPTVKAKAIHALIGALLLERGSPEAIRFVDSRLLSGDFSVFDIAESVNI